MKTVKFQVDKELFPFKGHFVALTNGCNMHYIDEGSGPVVLMLHGNPTWSFLYRHMVGNLRGRFRCIAPDLPGFGLSTATENYDFKARTQYRSLVEFIDALELEDMIVIGQDWGGPLGLKLAQERKHTVKGLVLGNTWGWPLRDIRRFRWFSRLNGGLLGRYMAKNFNMVWSVFMNFGFQTKLSPRVEAMYRAPFSEPKKRIQTSVFPKELVAAYDFEKEIDEHLSLISQMPVLFLWGIHDFAFKDDSLERFKETFVHHTTKMLKAGHFWQEDCPQEASIAFMDWYQKSFVDFA